VTVSPPVPAPPPPPLVPLLVVLADVVVVVVPLTLDVPAPAPDDVPAPAPVDPVEPALDVGITALPLQAPQTGAASTSATVASDERFMGPSQATRGERRTRAA